MSGLDCGKQQLGVFREEPWAAIKVQCHCQMAHKGRSVASILASFPTSGYCPHGLYDRLPHRQACTAWPLPQSPPIWAGSGCSSHHLGGSGSRCQWLSMHRGENEITAEIQGLCNLGSRAEIFPCGCTSCRFTTPLPAL